MAGNDYSRGPRITPAVGGLVFARMFAAYVHRVEDMHSSDGEGMHSSLRSVSAKAITSHYSTQPASGFRLAHNVIGYGN